MIGSAILRSTSGGSMVGPGEKRYFFSITTSFTLADKYYVIITSMSIFSSFFSVMPHSPVDFSRDPVGIPEKILYLPARSRSGEGRAETSSCLQTKRMIPYIKDYSTNGQCYPSP